MVNIKRYGAAAVLEELVAFAEGPIRSGPEARALLVRVLRAKTGFLVSPEPDLSGVNILRLRNELREFLRTGLRQDDGQQMPQARVEVAPAIVGKRHMVLVTVEGQPRDVLWFQIIRLMQLEGLHRLRQCECERVFVKVGRREYCSAKCQKRFYMRKFRAGEAGRE